MSETQFEAIMAGIQVLTGKVDSFDARFDKVESRLDKVESRLDNVEAQLGDINQHLKRIEHWTPYHANHDIMARLEALKNG